jgi:hypothetical protein
MTAVAAAFADPDLSKRKGQVVNDDHKVIRFDLLLLHPVADGISTQVHVSGGFQEKKEAGFMPELAYIAIAGWLKNNIGRSSKSVQYCKSRVVSGVGVFGTDITQSSDQIFHGAID